MSSSNCCFLTCIQVSQEAYQVAWCSHLFQNFPQLIVIHTVKGFGIANNAEIDVFLELSCFFDDPADIGNLISGSSAFSKTSLKLNSSTLATSCEELTHWKRLWCWEGLGAGVKGDDRGWDGWMASQTRWTCVWVNSGSWWWTGRPGVLQFMGSQRVRHDWATELNWTELCSCYTSLHCTCFFMITLIFLLFSKI